MTEPVIEIAIIDDLQNGAAYFSPLENIPGHPCHVNFIGLANEDALDKLKGAIATGPVPDIVLIDHVLDKTSDTSKELLQRGGSLVPIIREHWKKCPVLAITAEPGDCRKDVGSDNYEEVFDRQYLDILAQFIPSVVAGYRKASNIKTHDDLLKVIGVPEMEKDAFLRALPDSLKIEDLHDSPRFIHNLYHWFREVFYEKAGFLYNENWVALTMGVVEAHFCDYEEQISSCVYNGIWADPSSPRWWKAHLYSEIRSKCDNPNLSIQGAACKVFDIEEAVFSRCYSCNKIWPDTLAYMDEAALSSERQAMHLHCSEPHPRRQGLPYFEEERVMLEASE
jgi:hypothetical protein